MPAARRITKEAIIDAAVDVLRKGGAGAVNARSVAKRLGCSTQPLYLAFRSMEELKAAVTQQAIALHTQYVRGVLRSHEEAGSCCSEYSRYSSYGLGFVRFAAQEQHLFRWLYLDGRQPGVYQNDVLLPEILAAIKDEYGYPEDIARKLHQDMTYYAYGLAILAGSGHLQLTDAELLAAFRRELTALAAYYGVSPLPRRVAAAREKEGRS